MIKKIITTIILSILITITNGKEVNDSTKADFMTSGNCYLCKLRIEKAVKDCTGIYSIAWDTKEKFTSVAYDKSEKDLSTIMKMIAKVGHDTEWFESSDSSYKTLAAYNCCSYIRTMDYDSVQIGYLSLMDTWEATLSVGENIIEQVFNVYHSTADGLLHINSISNYNSNFEITLYSISGRQVYHNYLQNTDNSIDISNLPMGNYIIVLSNGNKLLHKQKILKI